MHGDGQGKDLAGRRRDNATPIMPQHTDPLRLPHAVAAATCARWLTAVDVARARLPHDHPDLAGGGASLRLSALGAPLCNEMLQTLLAGPVRRVVQSRLGEHPACLASQCWARLQHPPDLRPAGQHPHHWHQDGALGCRFGPGGDEALGELLTVWLPLTACGRDAPSLEWIDAGTSRLLQPAELTDAALRARCGTTSRHRALLSAGDALVFGGALLHRSHVATGMTQRRVSLEWRFVAEGLVQPRWASERLQPWPD
jgi:hypothetical protein